MYELPKLTNLKNKLSASEKETKTGFHAHLISLLASANDNYVRVMESSMGQPMGIEFKHLTNNEWVFIAPEMSNPDLGEYRIQLFNIHGFTSHDTFKTLDEVLEFMAHNQYCVIDKGRLDILAATDYWIVGTQVGDIIQQANKKIIDWKVANQKIDELRQELYNSSKKVAHV